MLACAALDSNFDRDDCTTTEHDGVVDTRETYWRLWGSRTHWEVGRSIIVACQSNYLLMRCLDI